MHWKSKRRESEKDVPDVTFGFSRLSLFVCVFVSVGYSIRDSRIGTAI